MSRRWWFSFRIRRKSSEVQKAEDKAAIAEQQSQEAKQIKRRVDRLSDRITGDERFEIELRAAFRRSLMRGG